MIYKIYLIDSDNGISLLETSFKEFENVDAKTEVFPGFFNIINKIINKIQEALSTGEKVDEMLRVIEAENSIIVIFYHPQSKVLFSFISQVDDDVNKLKEVMRKIANRFWKKHQSDLRLFRSTTDKSKFHSLIVDLENLTMGGKIAEIVPKLIIVPTVLDKILSMGIIKTIDYDIAIKCDGKSSPLKISREVDLNRNEVSEILSKLKKLDIIQF